MKKQSLLLILAVAALGLTACNNAQTGAVVGSLVGAGIGKSTVDHSDRRALIGAVAGGIVGGAIGQEQDRVNNTVRQTTTTHVNNNTAHSHDGTSHTHTAVKKKVVTRKAIQHQHGNLVHTHVGGAKAHAYQPGVSTTPEYVYSTSPPNAVSTSIIIGNGRFKKNPKRRYRKGYFKSRYYYNY